MIRFRINPFIVIFSLLLWGLLAACGPAAPSEEGNVTENAPSTTSEQEGSGNKTTNIVEDNKDDQSSENVSAPATAVESVSSTTDASGIQVGYTSEGRAYRGNPDAPVVIEEFSDFQCPFCGRFSVETLPSLLENQIANGEAVLIYYDFPLDSLHPQARAAANAARCAGEFGADNYWGMHDLIFSNIQEWGIADPNEVFARFGETLGLEPQQFSSCLQENRYADEIQSDVELGQSRNVRSTPSFFVNDQMLLGAQPLQVFSEAIASVQKGESIAQAQQAQPANEPSLDSVLSPPAESPEQAPVTADNAAVTLGSPDAPVMLVEYTDYQCPFCQRFSQESMPRILSDLIETGEVFYVLKDFPLDSIHPQARAGAVAARCAGEQDAYLAMHDAIFNAQQEWSSLGEAANEKFISMAGDLALDQDEFRMCISDGRYDTVIQSNLDEGLSFGVDSTPSFFIDGYPVKGAQPFELFEYAVSLAKEGTLADAYARPLPDVADAFAIGDPNAPIEIIEYTDYQCPYCSRHYSQTFTKLKEAYIDTGQVRYVFKDFPLTNIHPQAIKAAEAARCAADQDAYLPMHDLLFERQAEWNGRNDAPEIFASYAGELSLDTATFTTCLESGQHEAAVMADLEEGSNAGVNGTPAFFINDHFMSGAMPYAIFEQAIERFLAQS